MQHPDFVYLLPELNDNELILFAKSIEGQDASMKYIPIDAPKWSVEYACYKNVKDFIAQQGNGQGCFGWTIAKNQLFYQANHHTIYCGETNQLDVTLSPYGLPKTLFLSGTYNSTDHGKMIPAKRKNIYTEADGEKFIFVNALIMLYEIVENWKYMYRFDNGITKENNSFVEKVIEEYSGIIYSAEHFFLAEDNITSLSEFVSEARRISNLLEQLSKCKIEKEYNIIIAEINAILDQN